MSMSKNIARLAVTAGPLHLNYTLTRAEFDRNFQ